MASKQEEAFKSRRTDIMVSRAKKMASEDQELWDKPAEKRTPEEIMVYESILQAMVKPSNDDIAARVPREKLSEAREIADQLQRLEQEIDMTSRYRGTVNFDYWRARCNAEQTEEALLARELVHDAEILNEGKKSLNDARKKYEQAWDNWAIVYEKHPQLFDSIEAQELVVAVEHYSNLLGSLDVKFPADFKLKKLLDLTQHGQELRKRLDTLQAAAPEGTPSEPKEKKPESTDKPGEKPAKEADPPANAKENPAASPQAGEVKPPANPPVAKPK